jgi:hypothetical protein
MLEQRALYLINAELDGELEPGEQAELETILESSAEARTMRAELQKLVSVLDGAPQQTPPADLADRIIAQIRLPARRPAFSVASLFSSFQPAQAGLAFAAGLLLTVGFYEMTAEHRAAGDVSDMVGTMLADPQGRTAALKDSLSIAEPGISGTVSLSGSGGILVLNFELDSADETEIMVSLDESGVGFGGIARSITDSTAGGESYEVSGGTLRVVNQGQGSFSVYLLEKAGLKASGRSISIGISMGGAPVFSGVLQG